MNNLEKAMNDMRSTNPLINPQAYHEEELQYINWGDLVEEMQEKRTKVTEKRWRAGRRKKNELSALRRSY